MENKAKQAGVLENISWKFAERITAQLVTTVVTIVLARLLDPSHYGLISIVTIFITIANVFVSDGFGSALIQKKDADALDFSSVLYFNFGFSIVIYLILYINAPLISAFFGKEYKQLTPVLRVLGLRVILSGINSVQQAYISKNMIFKKFFGATITGTIISAIVGICMAYAGYGVWALVAQYLTNTTVDTVFLAFSLRATPLLKFSINRLRKLVGFGGRVLGLNLIITVYQEIRAILIGKYYTSEDLAYYNKSAQFPSLLITNINVSISSVLFPKFSQYQDESEKMKQLAKTSIATSFYVVAPLLLGLAAVSDTFVPVVLTEKWSACVPYLRLMCLNSLFYTVNSTNMQIVKAKGRSDILLKLEIAKKIIECGILIAVFRYGVIYIVIGMVFTSIAFTIINCLPTEKLIGYSFSEQMKDILPTLMLSGTMYLIVYFIGKIDVNQGVLLLIQIFVGGLFYVAMSGITNNDEFKLILSILLRYLGRGEKQ